MVLLGSSGCGKTIDTGLEVPTSRKVFLDNKLMNNIPRDHSKCCYGFWKICFVFSHRESKCEPGKYSREGMNGLNLVKFAKFIEKEK